MTWPSRIWTLDWSGAVSERAEEHVRAVLLLAHGCNPGANSVMGSCCSCTCSQSTWYYAVKLHVMLVHELNTHLRDEGDACLMPGRSHNGP